MDSDDPWDWPIERVIREFCSSSRTWTSPPGSMNLLPDTKAFAQQLSSHEIDGTTLLIAVTDQFIKEEMGIALPRFKLAYKIRFTITFAIDQFKKRSPQYQAYMRAKSPGSSQDQEGKEIDADMTDLSLGQNETATDTVNGGNAEAQTKGTPGVDVPQPQHGPADSARENHMPPTEKERASEGTISNKVSLYPALQDMGNDLMSQAELNALVDGEAAPLSAETADTDVMDPSTRQHPMSGRQDVDMHGDAPQVRVSPEAPAAIASTTEVQKKVRRLAPTFERPLSSRDRTLPTEADNVKFHLSDRMVPHSVVMGEDGKKRLAPNWISPTTTGSMIASGTANLRTEEEIKAAAVAYQTRAKDDLSKGYLGLVEMPVDDLFFGDTAMGAPMSQSEDEDDFSHCGKDISSGRRLYVARRMRHFLMSQILPVKKGGKTFMARRPYSEHLVPNSRPASIILAKTSEDGEVTLFRENAAQWPEVEPENLKTVSNDNYGDHHATLNVPEGEFLLGGPSSYDDWDPEQALRKWQHLPDDEVLPIFGESDEENEYDIDTWNEMQAEFGNIEQPMVEIKRKPISEAEVNEAMDEGMAMIQAKWDHIQRPKIGRRAFAAWMEYRKDPSTKRERIHGRLRKQQEKLDHLVQNRIPGMREEILKQIWTTKRQVHRQSHIMERSIYDREEILWEINLLKQKTPPEKPLPLPKKEKRTPSSRPANDEQKGGDSESLGSTSDEEDDDQERLSDFIVGDELDATAHMDMTDGSMSESESMSESDDSADESPAANTVKDDHDLDTPMADVVDIADADDENEDTDVKVQTPRRRQKASKDVAPIDLTDDTPPSSRQFSRRESEVIDLSTPVKNGGGPISSPNIGAARQPLQSRPTGQDTVSISDSDSESDEEVRGAPVDADMEAPPYEEAVVIAEFGIEYWAERKDHDRMLITKLAKFSQPVQERFRSYLDAVFGMRDPIQEVWGDVISVLKASSQNKDSARGLAKNQFEIVTGIIRLFHLWTDAYDYPRRTNFDEVVYRKLESKFETVPRFLRLCRKTLKKLKSDWGGSDADDSDDSDDFPARQEQSIAKVRVKPVYTDRKALSARNANEHKVMEQQSRREVLRKRLAEAPLNGENAELIINESKLENEGLIFVHSTIGHRIKEHQIEGIRFMWSQIVSRVADEELQGCLLAHTMGLGKTMQAITLLVAITEAANSDDPTISCQIPEHLRTSKTLVLCPPGLLDNWMDELLMWVPDDLLPKIGDFRKVDASMEPAERLAEIDAWSETGGILLMGYQGFLDIVSPARNVKEDSDGNSPDNNVDVAKARMQLLDGPNVVIADEAHKLKNASSKISMAAKKFRTHIRIALTGSPLSNNVVEYHSMIDWVAPNYLGPIVEFRARYVEPIQTGLYYNSTKAERRMALKKLEVLSRNIAPKVHRCGSDVLKDDLPPKTEFIIQVPLAPLQDELYKLYVRMNLDAPLTLEQVTNRGTVRQTTLWSWLSMLSLLCNHPACFRRSLEMSDIEAKKLAKDADVELEPLPPKLKERLAAEIRTIMPNYKENQNAIEDSYKMVLLCQILDAAREAKDKVLVFSQSIPAINFMERMFKLHNRKFTTLTGKTRINTRQEAVKDFNTGDKEVFLISTTAGGVGLNLHGANRVVIMDAKWNPSHEEQAVGRAYRLGQKKHVFVYRMIVGGTFEEKLQNQTVFKTQLASQVVDKKNILASALREQTDYLFYPKPVTESDLSEFVGKDPQVMDKVLATAHDRRAVRGIQMTEALNRPDDEALTPEERAQVERDFAEEELKRKNPRLWQANKDAEERVRNAAAHAEFARHQAMINPRANGQGIPSYAGPVPSSSAPSAVGAAQQRIPIGMGSWSRPASQIPSAQAPIMGSGTRMVSPDHTDMLLGHPNLRSLNMGRLAPDVIKTFEVALASVLEEAAFNPHEAIKAPERAVEFIHYIMHRRPNQDHLLAQRVQTATFEFKKYRELASDFLSGFDNVDKAVENAIGERLEGSAAADPKSNPPATSRQGTIGRGKSASSPFFSKTMKAGAEEQLAQALARSLKRKLSGSSHKPEITHEAVVASARQIVGHLEVWVINQLNRKDHVDKARMHDVFAGVFDHVSARVKEDPVRFIQGIDVGVPVGELLRILSQEYVRTTPNALRPKSPQSKKLSPSHKIVQPGTSTPTRAPSTSTSAQNVSPPFTLPQDNGRLSKQVEIVQSRPAISAPSSDPGTSEPESVNLIPDAQKSRLRNLAQSIREAAPGARYAALFGTTRADKHRSPQNQDTSTPRK